LPHLLGTKNLGAQLLRRIPEGELPSYADSSEDKSENVEVPFASAKRARKSSSSSSSERADSADSDAEPDEDGDDNAMPNLDEGATTANGNMLVVNQDFARSSAPKNFANTMKELPSKRPRKRARLSKDSSDE
jgi:hypothetical protein